MGSQVVGYCLESCAIAPIYQIADFFTLQVNLGVLKKNENVKDELLFCLREYHKLVEDDDNGQLLHKLCVGKSMFRCEVPIVCANILGSPAGFRVHS